MGGARGEPDPRRRVASTDELVAGVERGILVTDFWYTRILDPRTQVVTGLTRNGVWLIEDGRVVRPVTNLRFTQSFLDALGPGAVRGISRERAVVLAGWDSIYLSRAPPRLVELHGRREGLGLPVRRAARRAGPDPARNFPADSSVRSRAIRPPNRRLTRRPRPR